MPAVGRLWPSDDDDGDSDDDDGAAGARCSDNSEVLVEEGYLHSLRVTSFIHKIRIHQYHQYHQLSPHHYSPD